MAYPDIKRLADISQKPSRLIIGLMSGTSLDGLDIALCRITGFGSGIKAELLEFEIHPYTHDFKADLYEVFSKKVVNLEKLCLLNAIIGNHHAELILLSLKKWGIKASEIDCIASHGQTVYHAPKRLHNLPYYPNATLQIGDADHIAVKTGIITLSDFRQKHIAAGGEGAPLVLYGDFLLFSSDTENRVLLNIGGISNFTFLPAGNKPSGIISTDVGPGNTLIDLFAKKYFNTPYDKDGQIAARGKVNHAVLNVLLQHPFFSQPVPKTTGPEMFNEKYVMDALTYADATAISPADLLATVTRFTASVIAQSIKTLQRDDLIMYVSGGGAHNPMITQALSELIDGITLKSFADLGISPDAKEAVLFAVLANETLSGSATPLGNAPVITMGKISLPN